MACVLIINVLQMRGSIIIFTLGWPAAWGGGLGAHTPPSTGSLAASRWGRWHMSLGPLVSCHPSREYAWVSFPATSLTQQAASLCRVPRWDSKRHQTCRISRLQLQPCSASPNIPKPHQQRPFLASLPTQIVPGKGLCERMRGG